MGRSKFLLLVTVSTTAVITLGGCVDGVDDEPAPSITVVDPTVPEHELLDDVLVIDGKRSEGAINFSFVPETRPEGLTGLSATVADASIVDGYQVAGGPVQVMIEYAPRPTETCDGMKRDPGTLVCIRTEQMSDTAGDPKLRNLTVYYSQTMPGEASPDPNATRSVRDFWSTAKLVPASEAAWLTDLRTRAEAAPKTTTG